MSWRSSETYHVHVLHNLQSKITSEVVSWFSIHVFIIYYYCFSLHPPLTSDYWLWSDDLDPAQPLDALVRMMETLADYHQHPPTHFAEPTEFRHLSYDELTEFLLQYAEQYSNIARLYTVGKSVQGREMWVIEISDNPGTHEPGD